MDEVFSGVLVVILIGSLILLVGAMARSCNVEAQMQTQCVDTGYAGHVYFNEQYFCIGVVNSEWRIKLVERE